MPRYLRLSVQMKLLTIAICCLIVVPTAYAESRLMFLPGVFYFDYEETAEDGSFLDGETGPVPGISAQLEYQFASGIGAVVHGGIYSGTVDYDGHAEPSGEPATSKTDAKFFSLGALALFPKQKGEFDLQFLMGYQIRRWERDIQPTVVPGLGFVSGLYEVYEWEELSMGFEVTVDKKNVQQWKFYAGVFQTRNPEITIDLTADGDGEPRLFMGTDIGYQLSVQRLTKINNKLDLGARLSYKTWRFGRSNSQPISGGRLVTEPDSRTNLIMLEFVLAIPL